MNYPFKIQPLNYAYNALEPFLCSEILCYHHDKHYATYVNNLNKILSKYPSLQNLSLEEIIVFAEKVESMFKNELLQNAGGVYNHQLYFKCMAPEKINIPKSKLIYSIKKDFGSYAMFCESFINKSLKFIGSGYTWLIDNNGRLEIINTINQDTPLSFSVTPLLNIDLWEHSYYLQYKNDKESYVKNFFNIINWEYVEARYEDII